MKIRFRGSSSCASLRERCAQGLEDRLQHVLRVVAVDQAHVQGQARGTGELVEEARGEIGGQAPGTSLRLVERFRGVHDFLAHKWYFDELYDALFVRPTRAFGTWAANVFERIVVGGLVNGTAFAVRAGSSIVRVAQTGIVRNYALLLMTGVTALALYFLVVSR